MEPAIQDNTQLFRGLLASGRIQVEPAAWLWHTPKPVSTAPAPDRARGMLLGLAIGDALGNTSESLNPRTRFERFGEIRTYLPNRHAGNRRVGLPSDDTQMAFWTLEQLIQDHGLNPETLAERFSREAIFGMGRTVRAFRWARQSQGLPWERAGRDSTGNGALMRIAPVLLPHLSGATCALWADAGLAGMITHNNRASNASCIAWTALLWELLRLTSCPPVEWWAETFCAVAGRLEGDTRLCPRNPALAYEGPLWKFTQEQVQMALNRGWSARQACDHWYSGAYLLETVPCVLFILARHGHEPTEALVRAVNDTRDNDTVAALVGAALGALYGADWFPREWIANLSGRTGMLDDGHVQELICQAQDLFDPSVSQSGFQGALESAPGA